MAMKKAFLTIATITVLAISMGSAHAATVAELQAQPQVFVAQLSGSQSQTPTTGAPLSGAALCPNLARNLSRGSQGTDVMQLQQFLISLNLLASDSATGFFGPLTETAVKKFQCAQNIICSGTSANGYGTVGPRTRIAIIRKCSPSVTTPITQTRTSTCTMGAMTPATTCASGTPETIATLDYFLTTHTDKTLTGSHPLNQTISGQNTYFVKWDAGSYETYSWDNNYIYLKEDHSGAPNPGSYTFSDGRWLKRSMQVGETIQATNNSQQTFTVNTDSSCTPTVSAPFPYSVILEQHVPRYNMGGTLGVQDVIVVKYDYRYGASTDYEKMYYAKGWGLVKWELYRDDHLIQTSTFNQISNTAPVAPNLQSECRYTDITPIGAFIESLYRNVLGRAADVSGKTYYVNALNQNKTVAGCRLLLTDFYTSTEFNQRTISDQEFVTSLYRASFGREPDSSGLNFWLQKLSSSQMTRAQLRDLFIAHADTEAYCTKVVI